MRNQVAFITGASSGIGEALALEFARRGADLALFARRVDRLEDLKERIEKKGTEALVLAGSVTEKPSLDDAVKKTLERFGRIDFVVANAGFAVGGGFDHLTIEDYRRQFETNVFGAIQTAYATIPALKKTQGSICLIGSVNGWVSLPSVSAYVSSKFALRGFAESIYYEMHRHGVGVTHISPGFVRSEIRTVDNHGNKNDKLRDEIPSWLLMPASQAANKIVHAMVKRKPEQVITLHGKFGVFMIRHFPCVFRFIIKRITSRLRWRTPEHSAQKE